MITDPLFYLAAIPGVLLFGVSKGGFAGGFGIVTVPLMALTYRIVYGFLLATGAKLLYDGVRGVAA